MVQDELMKLVRRQDLHISIAGLVVFEGLCSAHGSGACGPVVQVWCDIAGEVTVWWRQPRSRLILRGSEVAKLDGTSGEDLTHLGLLLGGELSPPGFVDQVGVDAGAVLLRPLWDGREAAIVERLVGMSAAGIAGAAAAEVDCLELVFHEITEAATVE